jgi:hypothetical protein
MAVNLRDTASLRLKGHTTGDTMQDLAELMPVSVPGEHIVARQGYRCVGSVGTGGPSRCLRRNATL